MKKDSELNKIDSPRERLLTAAESLIYAGGIHATGVDAIIKKAGTGRKSFYQYFESKETLIAAALERRDERWMNWFIAGCSDQERSHAEVMVAMFDVLHGWFSESDFHGCAFLNAAGEISDANSPIRIASVKHKQRLLQFVMSQCEGYAHTRRLDQSTAETLSRQWLILIDGAIAVALVNADPGAALDAKKIGIQLLSDM